VRHKGEWLVIARDVSVAFGSHLAVEKVDLSIAAGEIVTLIGPNGSGKTTLVKAILGLQRPVSGEIRRRPGLTVGYMPQRLQIDPTLPLTVKRFLALWGKTNGGTIAAALEDVGAARLLDTPMQGLSGGELQRVLLARALLRNPDLLVLDEPVQGVDVQGQGELYGLIERIRNEHGCGVLLVSHDLHLVMARTDTVVCLNRHVCCSGHPRAVSQHPAFRALFGPTAEAFGIYQHAHNHAHDAHGDVVPAGGSGHHHHG
jgi:zinc transport system ATP-binding protein